MGPLFAAEAPSGSTETKTMPLHLLISVAIAVAGLAFFFWISLQDGEGDLRAMQADGESSLRVVAAPQDELQLEWKQAA
jgi:hypothetical protein